MFAPFHLLSWPNWQALVTDVAVAGPPTWAGRLLVSGWLPPLLATLRYAGLPPRDELNDQHAPVAAPAVRGAAARAHFAGWCATARRFSVQVPGTVFWGERPCVCVCLRRVFVVVVLTFFSLLVLFFV